MSMRDCIDAAVAAGELDPNRAREARGLFDEIERGLHGQMAPAEAARLAAEQTAAGIRRAALEKRRQIGLQARAWSTINANIQGFRGGNDAGGAIIAHLDRDELAGFSSIVARREAIRGRLHSRMTDVLATFRLKIGGAARDKATLTDLVREVFGTDTGNASARELARAWADAAEFARKRFNVAGGRIPQRADWGMPQIHDTLKVRRATYQQWRDFIQPKLNPARMVDEISGQPITPARLELALRDVYEGIRTDGFDQLRPGAAGRGSKLANRRLDHRFLVFKSADDWLAYQTRFGAADPFATMIGHLDGMARDIAMMEILGPNPHATLRALGELAEKRAAIADAGAGTTRNLDRTRSQLKQARDMFAHLTGTANTPIHGGVARTFAGLRSLLQAAQLGAAAISALTDVNFQRIAARAAGLPQTKVIGQVLNLLRPDRMEDRKAAVRLGLIAENWSSVAFAQARYTGEVSGPEITRRISDAVMRLSGLSPWTQAGRWAFGMEFMGALADHAGRAFGDLPPALQRTMRRYRIDAQGWDLIRRTDLYEHESATFLRPEDLAARTDLAPGQADDLATRILEMVQAETEFAVPSTSLRGRAMVVSDAPPGTIVGELVRSAAMYKNFALTLAFTHIRRAVNQGTPGARARYAADLVISTTLAGALAMQLKEIAKGRDARPMTGEKAPEFWAAAMLQGGGLGIFGDFLFSDVNRFDRGMAETIAGPVVGFANDLRRLTVGNLAQLPGEDPTNAGREAVNFVRRYTPGGSLWYARLAFERILLDQLQTWVDPQAHKQFNALERRYRRDLGQRFWWRPGQAAPDRAPDVAAAFEGGSQ